MRKKTELTSPRAEVGAGTRPESLVFRKMRLNHNKVARTLPRVAQTDGDNAMRAEVWRAKLPGMAGDRGSATAICKGLATSYTSRQNEAAVPLPSLQEK